MEIIRERNNIDVLIEKDLYYFVTSSLFKEKENEKRGLFFL